MGSQERSLKNTVSQTAESASLVVSDSKGVTLFSYKFNDHSNDVSIQQKFQQLTGKAMVPEMVYFITKKKFFFKKIFVVYFWLYRSLKRKDTAKTVDNHWSNFKLK